MKGDPRTLAAAAAAAVLTKERHGAAGVERGAAFVPFLFSGEAVAVEDPLQGGFHHPAAGVRNQQNLRSTLRWGAQQLLRVLRLLPSVECISESSSPLH